MDSLKLQYDTSIEGQLIFSRLSVVRMRCFPRSANANECLCVSELKRIQQTDVENLEKTLRETETSLSVRRLFEFINRLYTRRVYVKWFQGGIENGKKICPGSDDSSLKNSCIIISVSPDKPLQLHLMVKHTNKDVIVCTASRISCRTVVLMLSCGISAARPSDWIL